MSGRLPDHGGAYRKPGAASWVHMYVLEYWMAKRPQARITVYDRNGIAVCGCTGGPETVELHENDPQATPGL